MCKRQKESREHIKTRTPHIHKQTHALVKHTRPSIILGKNIPVPSNHLIGILNRRNDRKNVGVNVEGSVLSPIQEEGALLVQRIGLLQVARYIGPVVVGNADVVDARDEGDVGEAHLEEVGRIALDQRRSGPHEEDVRHRAPVTSPQDVRLVEQQHLPRVRLLAQRHDRGVDSLRVRQRDQRNVGEAVVDRPQVARELDPLAVDEAFDDAEMDLLLHDAHRLHLRVLVGDGAHPVVGEEAGEDAAVLVVRHAVHQHRRGEAEVLRRAVLAEKAQHVLLLPHAHAGFGREGGEEELEVLLGPLVLAEVAEVGQEQVLELR